LTPKDDALGLGQRGVAYRHRPLDGDRAGDGVDDAVEHDDGTIAHELHEATVMLGDQGLGDGST
jgi:hypothetical protein